MDIERLEPTAVWRHFATLCRLPRASKQEGPLRDHLLAWARERGLATRVDGAGNLLLRKPASRGREEAPALALQAHLDMVCQKNADTVHDFARDPIRPRLEDGWLRARDTTLGADNGIGVALILAALEATDLDHGPLEALLTVDEESGMGGARGLAADLLQGRLMLNLDTEDWGEFYLGCAGGLDVNVTAQGAADAAPAGQEGWSIAVTGLRGGHSGVDIHEDRGNAIKLLVRILRDLETRQPLRLARLTGGSARNALPREATALVSLPAGSGPVLAAHLAEWQALLRHELAGVDPAVVLACQPARAERLLAEADQARWLGCLHAAPQGVWRMSHRVPGVVETSDSLGLADLSPDAGSCCFMVRSLLESGAEALAAEIVSLCRLAGLDAERSGRYPGWAPNPDSPLLGLCQEVYGREFGGRAAVKVIHAGLECGLIAARYPGMDIVSLGPTIRGAHAPGEAVDVASVARVWHLLRAIFAALR